MTQDDGNRCPDEFGSQPSASVLRSLVECSCVQNQADFKAFLLGMLKNRDLAEEAFQRMVIRAIESAQSARASTLRGWLFRIAQNEARQILREQKRNARHQKGFAEQVASCRSEQDVTGRARWVLELGLVNEEAIDVLKQSIERLPEAYQEVIRRRMYEDQTFAEIAEQMKQPLGTVLTWMRRSLLRLKEDSQLRDFADDSQSP